MARSITYLFKRSFEYLQKGDFSSLNPGMHGIYILYNEESDSSMSVVYVGMVRGERSGIKGRLKRHESSVRKANLWSHYSIYEVWDNIPASLIEELEGLFRHLYRKDAVANKLNKQRAYAPLTQLEKASKVNAGAA